MELIKSKESYLEILDKGIERKTVSSDVIVPDSKPDVLKIIQVDARSVITDKGITSGGIYYEGRVYLNILYIPETGDEEVCSIKTYIDFKNRIDRDDYDKEVKIRMCSDVTRVEFSVLNSRKLSVRANVLVCYEIIGEKEIEYPVAIDSENVNFLFDEFTMKTIGADEECEFELNESFEIPQGKEEICEILKTDIKICDKELKVMTGKVICKANLSVCVLYLTKDRKTDFCEYEFPFTEVFDVYDMFEEDECRLDLELLDAQTDVSYDNDQSFRIINIKANICAKCRALRKLEVKYISDCYCSGVKTEVKEHSIKLNKFIDCIKAQNSVKETIVIDSKMSQIGRIYNVLAQEEITKVQSQNLSVITEGKIKIYLLYITQEAKGSVYSIKKEIPFSHTYSCQNMGTDMDCSVLSEIENISYNINSAGEVEIRCTLSEDITIYKKDIINIISELNTSDCDVDNDICIYFVKSGDTLWNIAKKYAVSVNDLKDINKLETDIIIEGQKLIIPCF